MQKIIPNLWFNKNAEEAGEFYASVFPKTTTSVEARYPETDLLDFQKDFAGLPLVVGVEIDDYRFTLINAGDQFRPNPSISFMLNFDPRVLGGDAASAREALDNAWAKLSEANAIHAALMSLIDTPCLWICTNLPQYQGLRSWGLGVGTISYDHPQDVLVSINVTGLLK